MKSRPEQPWILPEMSEGEIRRRHRKLEEEMTKRNIHCLVVAGSQVNYGAGSDNIRYLSNYGIFYGEGYIVFPLSGEPRLFCRSMNQEFNAKVISLIPTQISGYPIFARDIANYMKDLKLEGEKIGIVGAEIMPTNVFVDLKQRLPKADFHFVSDILLEMRLIKSAEELAFVEKAGEIADYAYEAIVKTAKPGRKEYELLAAIEEALTFHGAFYPSFILLCSGPSPVFPPSPASYRTLERGDTILQEISPCYGGYWIQWGRPFVIGEPDRKLYELYEVAMEVYQVLLKEIKPGVTFENVTNVAHDLIKTRGFTWVAGATQFIGLDITEMASMARGNAGSLEMVSRPIDKRTLESGMVIVNQPNIVTPDLRKGMLMIDTVIVTKDGCKVVSKAPLDYAKL